jgi:hypothetical protein
MPFKVIDLVGQDGYDVEFDRCGFFNPCPIVLGKIAHEGWEAMFMAFTIKPRLMSSLEQSFQRSKKPLQGQVCISTLPITIRLSVLG